VAKDGLERRSVAEKKAPRNEVAVRTTEGPKPTQNLSRTEKTAEVRRGRGRPKGSTNKPKSLVPKELANELLLIMKDQIPAEHFEYMKSVIKDGGAISTKQELDTMLLLLGRNLYPFLIRETQPQQVIDSDGNPVLGPDGQPLFHEPEFRKDVTERLKVWKSLLDTRAQIEKAEKPKDEGDSPVLKLWADRSMQGRVAILVNGVNTDVPADAGANPRLALPASGAAGDDDGTGRSADEA